MILFIIIKANVLIIMSYQLTVNPVNCKLTFYIKIYLKKIQYINTGHNDFIGIKILLRWIIGLL